MAIPTDQPGVDGGQAIGQGGKLSWSDTYRAMAADDEDWSDLDVAVADGLD